ncbi:predicted protein [Plenodomus lingam JN3]|uniref:Predicted protein n=1 Tax=Leptosphaeria maculans (strain JN3 / isolate v23.1.3 / race Av1-4-5-6-7-8) TaxID=985895 RepID=E5R446_LEPMJ|nr:predicted protein [Plenodomus lingam JN3]CBX91823.1 predicted protein [Plenodomus lingam JN3]
MVLCNSAAQRAASPHKRDQVFVVPAAPATPKRASPPTDHPLVSEIRASKHARHTTSESSTTRSPSHKPPPSSSSLPSSLIAFLHELVVAPEDCH